MELLKKGHVQSFDEYLIDALITVTIPLLTTASFIGMTEIATTAAFQWLQTKPRSLTALSTLCRLLNDIQTSKAEELKVHHMATGVECYMKQHGVSESEAVDEFYERIENAWKDINEEMMMMMRPATISNDLLVRILNYARLHDVGYKNDDGYTQAECVKDHVIALFVDPIPV